MSGFAENTHVRPVRGTPSNDNRAAQSSRCCRSSSTVGASIDTRRIWCVFVSLSNIPSAVRT